MFSSRRRTPRPAAVAGAVIVAALCAFSYRAVPGFFFTGADAFPLIESARLEGGGDLARVIAEPLMAGTGFEQKYAYYRPVVTLSFSLDHALWGLDPGGYHRTDIALVALCALLLGAAVSTLCRDPAVGWTAATLFTLHPVLAESVPAISRRHDALAMSLLLMTLVVWVGRRRRGARTWPALVPAGLALLSKESAVLFLPLLVAYELLWGADQRGPAVWRSVTRRCAAPALLALGYLLWRAVVVGGLGGRLGEAAAWRPEGIAALARVGRAFVLGLVDPAGLWQGLAARAGGISLAAAGVVVAVVALATCAAGCAAAYAIARRRRAPAAAPGHEERWLAFVFAWLLLPLAPHVLVADLPPRAVLVPALPFCALLATVLVRACRDLRAGALSSRPAVGRWALGAGAAVIAAALVIGGPIVRGPGGWTLASELGAELADVVAAEVANLPEGAAVHLYDMPRIIEPPGGRRPRGPRTVAYLRGYSIESWLRLRHPDRRFVVVEHKLAHFDHIPRLRSARTPQGDLTLRYE